MNKIIKLRSISFDTSFLLSKKSEVEKSFKIISKEKIPSFITKTVVSELERLRVFGRISNSDFKNAIKRTKKTNSKIIDFKNKLFSDAFSKSCVTSMEKYHSVSEKNIINDCKILVSALKNGVDLFLSEDYHFTSKITRRVINEVKNAACVEYNQMCKSNLYSIDARIFLKSYQNKMINLDIIESNIKSIKKSTKRI